MVERGDNLYLVDVREPVEREIVAILDLVLIPKDRILSGAALAELRRIPRSSCTARPGYGPRRRSRR